MCLFYSEAYLMCPEHRSISSGQGEGTCPFLSPTVLNSFCRGDVGLAAAIVQASRRHLWEDSEPSRGRSQPPAQAVSSIFTPALSPVKRLLFFSLIAAWPLFEKIRFSMLHPPAIGNYIIRFLSSSNLIRGNICLPKMRQTHLAPPLKQRCPRQLTATQDLN